jgi:tRNA(Ile)-lysidine synthetase-like protein
MRYIVAVSGGVDSVVLLHKLVLSKEHTLIVAHFDHGIRPESDADARFVEGLAKKYNVLFECRREELGPAASEATARDRRYTFLREMARKHKAVIVTAHHADDVIETIAINLTRGTGWRGLAVLDAPDIERPQLQQTKQEIYDYALMYRLEWVEDETNATEAYLRNRLRRSIYTHTSFSSRAELRDLHSKQLKLKQQIEGEAINLLGKQSSYSRYFFTHIDETVASELLTYSMNRVITRPQAERALHAIKTARPGTVTDVGAGVQLRFTHREFTIQTP